MGKFFLKSSLNLTANSAYYLHGELHIIWQLHSQRFPQGLIKANPTLTLNNMADDTVVKHYLNWLNPDNFPHHLSLLPLTQLPSMKQAYLVYSAKQGERNYDFINLCQAQEQVMVNKLRARL